MSLTSDPHAWLRPYFAELNRDSAFALLSPANAATAKAAEWKAALLERGWRLNISREASVKRWAERRALTVMGVQRKGRIGLAQSSHRRASIRSLQAIH